MKSSEQSTGSARLVWLVSQTIIQSEYNRIALVSKNASLKDGLVIDLPSYGYFQNRAKIQICYDNPAEIIHGRIADYSPKEDGENAFLIVDVQLFDSDKRRIHSEIDEDFKSRIDKDLEPGSNFEFSLNFSIQNLVHNIAKNVVICANLAKVGSLSPQPGYIIVGDDKMEISGFYSRMSFLKYIEDTFSFRLLRDISFIDAWHWYSNLSGILTSKPTNDVEISVCNFVSLFDESYDNSGARDLIWSFAGLEALLAESESGIVSQLRSKLIAVFGNQVDVKDFDKQIKEMHQSRSNIIHGKTKDVPTLQRFTLQKEEIESQNQQTRTSNIAMYILVAMIQYCCQNRISELKFKTVVI